MELHENFFTMIAKILATPMMKVQFGRLNQKFQNDPELQSSLQSLKFYTDKLEKDLMMHCKRHPDSKHCKDLSKSKK